MRLSDLVIFAALFAIQVQSQDSQGFLRLSPPRRQIPHLFGRQTNTCVVGTKQCSPSVPICVLITDVCCTGGAAPGGSCPIGYYCVDTDSTNPGCCTVGTISCGPVGDTCCPTGLQCVPVGATFNCLPVGPTIATTVGLPTTTATRLQPSSVSTSSNVIPLTTTALVTVTPTSDPTGTPIPNSNKGALIGGLVGGN
jgi:hypothetical protein